MHAKIVEKGETGEKAEEELMTSFKKLKLIENETIYTIKLVRNKSEEAIEVSGKKQNLPSPKPESKEENCDSGEDEATSLTMLRTRWLQKLIIELPAAFWKSKVL